MTDEVAGLLRELIAEVRALRVDVQAAGTRRDPLREEEHAELARLVGEISQSIGAREFTTRELVDYARTFDCKLVAALHRAGCGYDSRKIGKRLQRSEGRVLQGYKVDRIKEVRDGTLWRVTAFSRVSLTPTPAASA